MFLTYFFKTFFKTFLKIFFSRHFSRFLWLLRNKGKLTNVKDDAISHDLFIQGARGESSLGTQEGAHVGCYTMIMHM